LVGNLRKEGGQSKLYGALLVVMELEDGEDESNPSKSNRINKFFRGVRDSRLIRWYVIVLSVSELIGLALSGYIAWQAEAAGHSIHYAAGGAIIVNYALVDLPFDLLLWPGVNIWLFRWFSRLFPQKFHWRLFLKFSWWKLLWKLIKGLSVDWGWITVSDILYSGSFAGCEYTLIYSMHEQLGGIIAPVLLGSATMSLIYIVYSTTTVSPRLVYKENGEIGIPTLAR